MKTRKKFWFYTLAQVTVILILLNSCEKDDNNSQQNTVADIELNVYQTVTIGTQVWLAENLRTTKYNDGTPIPNVITPNEWVNLSSGAYCWYNNDQTNYGSKYGALYNWYSVNSEKLCPAGWHVPTDNEWTILANYIGGTNNAGLKLKTTYGWYNSGNGTDNYNFRGLPGGILYSIDEEFSNIKKRANWWTASNIDGHILTRVIKFDSDFFSTGDYNETGGLSVRCIKDN